MAPQFVDYNADGITDLFTATFDGSPWVALGTKEGFKQPETIKDKNGERVMLSQYWDYEAKKWTNKDHTGGVDSGAHCISAYAFDWDADGDFDLVLGGRNGNLWLQLNEGSAKEPKFSGLCKQIQCEGKALDAGDKISSPRLIDWDGDGLSDIVIGTYGDSYVNRKAGSVMWFRNTGKKGAPEFAAPKALIECGKAKNAKEPSGPDSGLYFDVIDFDGDGDLDLVVGGYSVWAEDADSKSGNSAKRKPYVWVYTQAKAAEAAK